MKASVYDVTLFRSQLIPIQERNYKLIIAKPSEDKAGQTSEGGS